MLNRRPIGLLGQIEVAADAGEVWYCMPEVQLQSMALALQTVYFDGERHRRAQHLEPVWTGPDSQIIPLHRIDQALLQLMNEAT